MQTNTKIHLSSSEALAMCKAKGLDITRATLHNWVSENKLGFQARRGGHYLIYPKKFRRFLRRILNDKDKD